MAQRFLTGVLLWILAYHTILVLSGSSSPIIGDADEGSGNQQSHRRLYLNTERPATCNGTVSVVRYCYYGHTDFFVQQTYRSLIALYRPVNESHYKRISETISVTKRSYPAPLTPQADNFLPGFSCDTQKLTSSVEVQTGDIVGFCTFDSGGISQIDMVTTRNVLLFVVGGYSMMFEGADTAGCNTGVMPQVVGDRLQQASIFRILHVSAEIIPHLASNPTMMSTTLTTNEVSSNTSSTGETGEFGNTLIVTIVAIGGVLSTALVVVIIITTTCCFVVHCRQKRIRSNENADAFTSNTAYHARNDRVAMGVDDESDNSSSAVYDYISNATEPAGFRNAAATTFS